MQIVNRDLVLKVSKNVDHEKLDLNQFEPFLDALCGDREYQKDAIRSTLRFFLGGQYNNLEDLAKENFENNQKLRDYYGSFDEMKRWLQIPEKLSCSVDLATGTGKSWVIYGVARIMLALGEVDYVLVNCPSTTIETGLIDKFKLFSGDDTLRDLLPHDSIIKNPHIINATESITKGDICVENCHALYEHVKSSIREGLAEKGDRTLVINDETHHVYNQTGKEFKKWKDFLVDEDFSFKYILGVSGTCYIENEYFTDVISRYSLREAIEEGYVKSIEYVSEDSSSGWDEKFQKLFDNHNNHKTQSYRLVRPLTILVSKDIRTCNDLTQSLINSLAKIEGIPKEDAASKVLEVTSSQKHKENVRKLAYVDDKDSPVEWITSVSMLTEGWDVKNVFQIVPHEERAFNSKLLIAQVLGRGLRVPKVYEGQRPIVTVFNHANWSGRIKHLVDEVLEIENRIYSYTVDKHPDYNFDLHNINYNKLAETEDFMQEKEYEFKKGFITLIRQSPALERSTIYERAVTGISREKRTLVKYKMFPVSEIVEQLQNRFKSIDMETEDSDNPTSYAEKFNILWLTKLIRNSLKRINENDDFVSEENRNKIFQAFGVIHRPAAKVVRYRMSPRLLEIFNTKDRRRNSIGLSAIKKADATVFWDDNSILFCEENEKNYINELLKAIDYLPGAAQQKIDNSYNFKTPLGVVITDHKPERGFVRAIVKEENAKAIDAWIKSTDQEFYKIEYAWKKGEHPKRGSFNPDFFIKIGSVIMVAEIKGDEEIANPSDENKAKWKAAKLHFKTLNGQQNEVKYHFNYLTPEDYDYYFDNLRKNKYLFTSKLDAELEKNGLK